VIRNETADPYATLGVPRTASAGQVRAAYRRLAKQYHPDVQPDAHTTERMQRINQAWEILSSPTRRARHDATTIHARPTTAHWGGMPRQASPIERPGQAWTPPPQAWASYGARGYADVQDKPGFGPLRWAGLLLLVPLVVLLATVLSGGLLPFPLLGVILLVIAGRIGGRD
jgi:curved DNA-binding protein CbpA